MPASLELVKIALQAYAAGDCEIALALAGPHIRWDERASRPEGDLVWGRDKVQRAMRRYLDGWEEYRFDLEDVAEVGPGKVVGICRERGKPKEGPAVDRRFGGLWVVENGTIASWATYLTPREAVRAAKQLAGPQAAGREKPEPMSQAPKQTLAAVEPSKPEPPPVETARPEPAQGDGPFDFVEAEHGDSHAPEPDRAPVVERPRKRTLTKSEEQKRAARARAKLRKQISRQSA